MEMRLFVASQWQFRQFILVRSERYKGLKNKAILVPVEQERSLLL